MHIYIDDLCKVFFLRHKTIIYLMSFVSLLFLLQSITHAQSVLVLNVVGQPPLNTVAEDGFMDEVVREAFLRLGYKLVIERLPAERGLYNANIGLIDGEMSRVRGIDKRYKNLIQVPEKIMDWDFHVFSKKDIILDDGWASLSGETVAYIRGWKILEDKTPKSSVVAKTKNSLQLFSLLKKGRADFIIYERWGGNELINKINLKNVRIRMPALARKEMFIYLHKKHAALIPEVAKSLAGMKEDGSYNKLVKKHLIVIKTLSQ